jgi:hypothetical protein
MGVLFMDTPLVPYSSNPAPDPPAGPTGDSP